MKTFVVAPPKSVTKRYDALIAKRLGISSTSQSKKEFVSRFAELAAPSFKLKPAEIKKKIGESVTLSDAVLNPLSVEYGIAASKKFGLGAKQKLGLALWLARLNHSLVVVHKNPAAFKAAVKEIRRAQTLARVGTIVSEYRLRAMEDYLEAKALSKFNIPLSYDFKKIVARLLPTFEKGWEQPLRLNAGNPNVIAFFEELKRSRRI